MLDNKGGIGKGCLNIILIIIIILVGLIIIGGFYNLYEDSKKRREQAGHMSDAKQFLLEQEREKTREPERKEYSPQKKEATVKAKNCIEIIRQRVNIRFSPSTSSSIVCQAQKGDIFEMKSIEGEWYKINMFSGEYRYVHKSLAESASCVDSVPDRVSTRRDIFLQLLRAEDRAQAEADQKYPLDDGHGRPISANLGKNVDYMRLLNDRYKLQVTQKSGIQPTAYKKIVVEGVKNKWY